MVQFVSAIFSDDFRRYIEAFAARSVPLAVSPDHFARAFNQAAQEQMAKATAVSFEGDVREDIARTLQASGA